MADSRPVSRSVPLNVGLALPLRALQLGSPDGWDFGWCAVDANDRVIGYAMTEAQARQLVAPFAAASENRTPVPDGILDTYINRHDRDTEKIKAMRDKLAELCDRLDWKGPARESNIAITVQEARAMIKQHDCIAAGVEFIVNGLLGDD